MGVCVRTALAFIVINPSPHLLSTKGSLPQKLRANSETLRSPIATDWLDMRGNYCSQARYILYFT